MSFVPHTFILFMYDASIGTQTYIDASYVEQHLIDKVNEYNDSLYYVIYKYKCNSFHFGSKIEAQTYQVHRVMKGKKNTGFFPFSPYELAYKFESEYDWYYQMKQW